MIRQVLLDSNEPWLICVFREDRQALGCWRRGFERLPFASVREVLPSQDPDRHEFIVNDEPAQVDAPAAAKATEFFGTRRTSRPRPSGTTQRFNMTRQEAHSYPRPLWTTLLAHSERGSEAVDS